MCGGVHRVHLVVEGENGVLRGKLAGAGHNHLVEEGKVLGARHAVIAVDIVQREDVVTPGLEVAQGELSLVIGAADTVKGQLGESRIVEIAVKAHDDVLHGLQVACTQRDAAHGQRVDGVAGGEGESVAFQRIAFVEILDGVGEVDAIGGVGNQRVAKFHSHLFPLSPHHGHLTLNGRDNHFFLLVFQGDVLVEGDFHFVALDTQGALLGRGLDNTGWGIVHRAALGRADSGTRPHEQSHESRNNKMFGSDQIHFDGAKLRISERKVKLV